MWYINAIPETEEAIILKEDILKFLQREIMPTIGSVELANVALCTAYATSTVGGWAQEIDLEVSPEIMERAIHDRIPQLDLVGLEYAAALGTILLNPDRRCMLMAEICDESLEKASRPEVKQHVHVSVRRDISPWYVHARVYTDWGIGTAEILEYPGDLAFLQMAARKLWEKEPEQTAQETAQKKLAAALTDEQLETLLAEYSEKDLTFLKPGLEYTRNLLDAVSEERMTGIDPDELAEKIEQEVRNGSELPCMTVGYDIHAGAKLYLKALQMLEENDSMEETLRMIAREACRMLADRPAGL